MRASAMLEVKGRRILIDCGPDFHTQMLRFGRRSPDDRIDTMLATHQHYDHVGGVDDLRPYTYRKDDPKYKFPIYCQADVARDLKIRMPYSLGSHPYPGAPRIILHEINAFEPFTFEGIDILPLRVNHYILEMLGFRIGALGYITDAKTIPDRTVEALKGVDTLIINALRFKPHISHQTVDEALEIIRRINPRQAFLTHLSHDVGLHAEVERKLQEKVEALQAESSGSFTSTVHFAYDGLTLPIPD